MLLFWPQVSLPACGNGTSTKSEYKGISTDSPDWVANLDAAATADQMLVVAAFDETATDAWISLHEKQKDGTWKMIMTSPGFIGKNGLGKTKEGDAKTPTGVFHFNRAFGIADDPGCKIPYVKVDNDTYWSGDPREGFHYNELVNWTRLCDLFTLLRPCKAIHRRMRSHSGGSHEICYAAC